MIKMSSYIKLYELFNNDFDKVSRLIRNEIEYYHEMLRYIIQTCWKCNMKKFLVDPSDYGIDIDKEVDEETELQFLIGTLEKYKEIINDIRDKLLEPSEVRRIKEIEYNMFLRPEHVVGYNKIKDKIPWID